LERWLLNAPAIPMKEASESRPSCGPLAWCRRPGRALEDWLACLAAYSRPTIFHIAGLTASRVLSFERPRFQKQVLTCLTNNIGINFPSFAAGFCRHNSFRSAANNPVRQSASLASHPVRVHVGQLSILEPKCCLKPLSDNRRNSLEWMEGYSALAVALKQQVRRKLLSQSARGPNKQHG
jgi:hypothetical protein